MYSETQQQMPIRMRWFFAIATVLSAASIQASVTTLEPGVFIGGHVIENFYASVVDVNGDVVICGDTNTQGLGTPGSAYPIYDSTLGNAAFVAKVSGTDGSLMFFTYLDGSGGDYCFSIDADSNGEIVVGGTTTSEDFPVLNAFGTTFEGGPPNSSNNGWDGWVTKLTSDGTAVVFSTYIGGFDARNVTFVEAVLDVHIDADDAIHLAGRTNSANFPVTQTFADRPVFSRKCSFCGTAITHD